MLDRILRGDHQKRLRQRIGVRVHRDLAFVHGLEQRRLRLRRGAVDFVGQQNVGEDRAALEFELLLGGGVDRNAQHVGRQHVAGELHALKTAIESARQRLAKRGLAHAGNAFDQQVSAGQHGNQGEADDFVLAADDFAERVFQSAPRDETRPWRFQETLERFYYAVGGAQGYGGYRASSWQLALALAVQTSADNPRRPDAKCQVLSAAYCVNSAGRPVSRSIRLAIGGWVENRLPKFIPRNG